jgi:hypothetical protein
MSWYTTYELEICYLYSRFIHLETEQHHSPLNDPFSRHSNRYFSRLRLSFTMISNPKFTSKCLIASSTLSARRTIPSHCLLRASRSAVVIPNKYTLEGALGHFSRFWLNTDNGHACFLWSRRIIQKFNRKRNKARYLTKWPPWRNWSLCSATQIVPIF